PDHLLKVARSTASYQYVPKIAAYQAPVTPGWKQQPAKSSLTLTTTPPPTLTGFPIWPPRSCGPNPPLLVAPTSLRRTMDLPPIAWINPQGIQFMFFYRMERPSTFPDATLRS